MWRTRKPYSAPAPNLEPLCPAADLDTPPIRLVEAPVIPAELPPPPTYLSEAMQTWWQAVVRDYDLGPHHLHLLECAADAWDRMVQARDTLRVPPVPRWLPSRWRQAPPPVFHADARAMRLVQSSAGYVFLRMRAPLRRVSLAPGQRLTAAAKVATAGSKSCTPARCSQRFDPVASSQRSIEWAW